MSRIYNTRGNSLDRLFIQYNSQDEAEAYMIKEIEEVQYLVDEIYRDAKELIKKELGYSIDLKEEELAVNANIFPNKSRLGHYSRRGAIELNIENIEDYKAYLDGISFTQAEGLAIYDQLIQTMIHEIGHRIHDIHFNYKTVRLPREGRTEYSKKNGRENFAEAFENLITQPGSMRFLARNTVIRKVLDNKFDPQPIEIRAAKDTIPERRKTLITLDQICEEVGMTTKSARVKLRKSGKFTKGESGWAWSPDDTENIEAVKTYLKGGRK